ISYPGAIGVGPDGSVYFIDTGNQRVRRIGPDGIITTIAGTGQGGFSGDGGPAIQARLFAATGGADLFGGLSVPPDGSIFFMDPGNSGVRRIDRNGVITTIIGRGPACCFAGDGGPATSAGFDRVSDLAYGPDGSIYIADYARIRRVGPDGIISTIAGTGVRPS